MKTYDCQITLSRSRGTFPVYACRVRCSLTRLRFLLRSKCELHMLPYGLITAFRDDCSIVRCWCYENGKISKV